MEWLVIVGLGVWVLLLARHIDMLTQRLTALERRVLELAPMEGEREPVLDPLLLSTPLPPEDQEPLILDQPLPPDYREPLLLDTPLPEASNDDGETEPPFIAEPIAEEPAPVVAATAARSNGARALWRTDTGWPWIAGVVAALGAMLLIRLAAQQTWFPPPLQVGAAIAFGIVLLAAGEWIRRGALARPLMAALLTGAGGVAMFAAVGAAHGAHGFIGPQLALLLLLVCAAALFALSFVYGELLGALAVIAALAAPAIAAGPTWPAQPVTLLICVLAAGGFALAYTRRWAGVAVVTLAGLYFWFAAAVGADELRRALAVLSTASLGATLIALKAARTEATPRDFDWWHVRALGPSVAIAISSVLLLWVWLAAVPIPSGRIAGPALISAFHVALASYAVRARLANYWTLVVTIGALVLGFMAFLQARFHFGSLSDDFYPTVLAASLIAASCTITARPHHSGRALVAGAGAFGAAVLAALSASSRADWHSIAAWAPLFIGAALLFAAAWRAEEDAPEIEEDAAIDLWAAAGVLLVLLGIESAVPAAARSAAHAGVALLLAVAHAWRGWRVLRPAAIVAALIALAHTLSPALAGAGLSGDIPIWGALVVIGATAALLFGAGYFLAQAEERSSWSETLTTAGVVAIVIGALLLLRWIAAGGFGFTIELMSETALRALILMIAGHALLPRNGHALGLIGRWRGQVMMGLGLAYLFYVPGLAINPWWGGPERTAVMGPPLLDTLTLAFVLPAAVVFAAAYRLYKRDRVFARFYAVMGGMLLLLWAMLQVRRAFQGADMADTPIGWAEGGCYALVFIAAALAVTVTARVRAAAYGDGPFTQDLMAIVRFGESLIAGLAALPRMLRPTADPGELLTIKRDGRRERRRGRRYRSS